MRRPTPEADALAWWSRAIAGLPVDRHEGVPHCGYYKRRWVKDGPWVPARIYIENKTCPVSGELTEDEVMRIEIEGLDAGSPAKHWMHLKPISREDFDRLVDMPLRDSRFFDSRSQIDLSAQPTLPQGVF